jgi:AP-4 complex subunit beta-1
LGQFGEHIEDSPYILEKIIEEEQETGSTVLQSYLVTACTKLFFKRAPEMQHILGSLYNQIMKSSPDSDLR